MKYLLFLFIVLHGLSIHAQTPCANPIIASATGFDGNEYLAGYSVEFQIEIPTNAVGYWDFGDGTSIQTIYSWADNFDTTHSFAEAGTYDILFTFGDDLCTANLTITVLEAPILIPIIPDYFEGNPKWCVTKSWSVTQGGCIHYVDQVHYITGDTVFNNITYKKLYTRGVNAGCGAPSDPYNYIEDYLRQDGEIIYRYYPSEDAEHILYDFSLSVGDTIPSGGINGAFNGDQIFPETDNLIYVVNEIDSIQFQGEYYKKIYFSVFSPFSEVGPISYAGPDYYMEGIGHPFGFIWQYRWFAEWETYSLNAYSKNDSIYYGSTLYCDFAVSVKENFIKKVSIEIYPNPVINEVNIEVTEGFQIEFINIYSINGKKLQSKKVDISNVLIIDVNELQSGMYLLEVISTDRYRDVKQFIIK